MKHDDQCDNSLLATGPNLDLISYTLLGSKNIVPYYIDMRACTSFSLDNSLPQVSFSFEGEEKGKLLTPKQKSFN